MHFQTNSRKTCLQMAFFLAFTPEGRQVFSVQEGNCSALMAGSPVTTHHSNLESNFTKDPSCGCQRGPAIPNLHHL
jgi:hypothetical protein